MRISNKLLNYDLYQRGYYGNKLRTWNSLEEILDSGYHGLVSTRYKLPDSRFSLYAIPVKDLAAKIDQEIARGAKKEYIVFNETAPDNSLTIQGELQQTERHLTLFYSTKKCSMRQALKVARQIEGLKVEYLLRHYLTPSSYSDLEELLELYSGHVIEFSTFSMTLGDRKGRNTVIWEVRDY